MPFTIGCVWLGVVGGWRAYSVCQKGQLLQTCQKDEGEERADVGVGDGEGFEGGAERVGEKGRTGDGVGGGGREEEGDPLITAERG